MSDALDNTDGAVAPNGTWEDEVELALRRDGRVRGLAKLEHPPCFLFTMGPEEASRTWAVALFLEPQRLRPSGLTLKLPPYLEMLERGKADALLLVTLNGLSAYDQAAISTMPHDIRNCSVQQLKSSEFDLGTYAPRTRTATARRVSSEGIETAFRMQVQNALERTFGSVAVRNRQGRRVVLAEGDFAGTDQTWAVCIIRDGSILHPNDLNTALEPALQAVKRGDADGLLLVTQGELSENAAQHFDGIPFAARTRLDNLLRAAPLRESLQAEVGGVLTEVTTNADIHKLLAQHFANVRVGPLLKGQQPDFTFTVGPVSSPLTWAVEALKLNRPGRLRRGDLKTVLSSHAAALESGGLHGLLIVTRKGPTPDAQTFVNGLRQNIHICTVEQLRREDFDLGKHAPRGDKRGDEDEDGPQGADDFPLGRAISTSPGSEKNEKAQAALGELAKSIRGANQPILRACRNEALAARVESFQKSLTFETVFEKAVKLYERPLIKFFVDRVAIPTAVREAGARAWDALCELFPNIFK